MLSLHQLIKRRVSDVGLVSDSEGTIKNVKNPHKNQYLNTPSYENEITWKDAQLEVQPQLDKIIGRDSVWNRYNIKVIKHVDRTSNSTHTSREIPKRVRRL